MAPPKKKGSSVFREAKKFVTTVDKAKTVAEKIGKNPFYDPWGQNYIPPYSDEPNPIVQRPKKKTPVKRGNPKKKQR